MDQYPCTPSLILRLLLPALACGLPLELGSLVPHDHRPTAAALTLTFLSFIPNMKSNFLGHHPKAQGLIPKWSFVWESVNMARKVGHSELKRWKQPHAVLRYSGKGTQIRMNTVESAEQGGGWR